MDKSKSYMYVALTIALLVGAYAALSYVGTYSASVEPSSFRSFAVTAQGKVVTVPDVAEFNFSVVTEGGTDLGSLQEANTEKMNKAIEFVKSSGVDAKDIQTNNYYINPRYQYYNCGQYASGSVQPCPPAEIVGYTVTQNVDVKLRDFSKIGEVLSGVVKNGANTVSQLQFTIDDPEKAKNDARADAIEKAMTQAEEVADAAGFSVGRLLSVDESGYNPYYYDSVRSMKAMASGMGGAESAPVPAIEPGSQEVNVTVTLRYEIK